MTAAVGEAYRAYYRRLVAVVYAATGDYAEAQDVVQPLSMTFGGGYVGRYVGADLPVHGRPYLDEGHAAVVSGRPG
ncbi:MAG: hypothetical protein AUI10_03650 [Actinobacteria bacterium 13_2_20CM_2_72_6]|nr:MAG: hypothetical protein AUI10_03650 [Actinobacteria bacterium 13_2_20CM_2_72_6]